MKAVVVRPDGTRIEVEGTEEEVLRLLAALHLAPVPVLQPCPVPWAQPVPVVPWWPTYHPFPGEVWCGDRAWGSSSNRVEVRS